jgi:nucleoside-diphosphate-sugar epimerase
VSDTLILVGIGYVGRRLVESKALESIIGLSRSTGFDLDADDEIPLSLPVDYSVLYTVPPSQSFNVDVRIERLFARLDPLPARFVYISTTGVYGDCGGAMVDEERPVNPESERAGLRVAAEMSLQAWCKSNDVACVVLRVPGIYGPGRLGVDRIRTGAANIRDAEANPGNRIHVDDLVSCCVAALSKDAPPGIYNVGDGDFRSATWFASEVARQCGEPPPPEISFEAANREFSAMRMSFLRESRRIDTRKMRDVLGVRLRYSNPVDGIHASLREEGSQAVGGALFNRSKAQLREP